MVSTVSMLMVLGMAYLNYLVVYPKLKLIAGIFWLGLGVGNIWIDPTYGFTGYILIGIGLLSVLSSINVKQKSED